MIIGSLKKFFSKIILLCLLLAALVFLCPFGFRKDAEIAMAGVGENVNGFAWSSNVGWISFNSLDCDSNGNGFVDTDVITPGCGGSDNATTPVFNYGVNIDNVSGNFSGYAWSSNVGWISFEDSNPPDSYAFNSNCSGVCSGVCTACYNISDHKVYGWAKILSLGDDGWIKFNDASWTDVVEIDSVTGYFSGWAYNEGAGAGIGWISFNSSDCDTDNNTYIDAACGGDNATDPVVDYHVYGDANQPLSAINLSSPNNNPCLESVLNARLRWDFSDTAGDSEKAYQIIFDDDNNPTNPLLDTGKCDAILGDCLISPGADNYPIQDSSIAPLSYGAHYYWWVRVWDQTEAVSNWATSTLNGVWDGSDYDVSFVIPLSEYPEPMFSWFPQNPSAGEEVSFVSNSSYYPVGNSSAVCDDVNCSYAWSITTPGSINNASASSTIIIFSGENNNTVTLEVTDDKGQSCSHSETIGSKESLPSWIETK